MRVIGERERANLVVQLARFFHDGISDLGQKAEAHAHSPEICHIHCRRSFFTVCSLLMASEHPTANMESVDGTTPSTVSHTARNR